MWPSLSLSRAGFHRWRKLASFRSCSSRTTSTLPSLLQPLCTKSNRTPALSSLRRPMGRDLLGPFEGSRQLRRCQEEAGEPEDQQARSWRGERQEGKAEGKSKERGQREERRHPPGKGGNSSLKDLKSSPGGMAGPLGQECASSRPDLEPRVPGAAASTYTGVSLLQSFLRHLLSARCRISGFARSFVTWHFDHHACGGTASKELFPLPVPYPEVFWKKSCEEDKKMSLKKGVVAAVIALNYLYSNRPKTCDWDISRQLSKRQWGAIGRLENLMEAWISAPPVTPEVMGRTAGKVESLEEALSRLQRLAEPLAKTGGYHPDPQRGKKVVQQQDTAGPRLCDDGMSTFKPVQANRLTFVGVPSFDPTPYLDPLSRRIYSDPLGCRVPPSECKVSPPRLKIHCSRGERIKLFELLDSSRRLNIHLPHEVEPRYGSGLFAVVKNLEKDRLILDSRGANLLEAPPRRWIKSLAAAESLTKLVLEDGYNLAASGNDLTDFYYLFKSSSSRDRRNVLVSPMNPKEIQHLSAVKEKHLSSPVVYGSLATLAMGDCQAVELAQSCHLGLALQHGIVNADNLTTMNKPVPRTSTVVGLVIDDFITISKIRADGEPGHKSEGATLADTMQDIYEEVKLIPNRKKAFRDELNSSFWGVDLDGEKGVLRGSLKRAIPLAGLLLQIVKLRHATGNLMQIVLGSVISLFLYRRRFLCLLDSLFQASRRDDMQEVFRLDGRALSDLLMLSILLPLAATNLRAKAPCAVAASDASNWGEAAVVAPIPELIGKELVRHSLRKSVWSKLLGPVDAWLRGQSLLEPEDELPDPEECFQSNQLWSLLAGSEIEVQEVVCEGEEWPTPHQCWRTKGWATH